MIPRGGRESAARSGDSKEEETADGTARDGVDGMSDKQLKSAWTRVATALSRAKFVDWDAIFTGFRGVHYLPRRAKDAALAAARRHMVRFRVQDKKDRGENLFLRLQRMRGWEWGFQSWLSYATELQQARRARLRAQREALAAQHSTPTPTPEDSSHAARRAEPVPDLAPIDFAELVAALSLPESSEIQVVKVTKALTGQARLMQSTEDQSLLLRAARACKDVLLRHKLSARVVLATVHTLAALTASEQLVAQLIELNTLHVVCVVLGLHRNNPEICEAIFKFVGDLAHHHSAVGQEFRGQPSALEVSVEVLGLHDTCGAVLDKGLWMIFNLICNNTEGRAQLAAIGGIALVVATAGNIKLPMVDLGEVHQLALWTLNELVCDEMDADGHLSRQVVDRRATMVAVDGIRVVVRVLWNYADSAALQLSGCRLLCWLCKGEKVKSARTMVPKSKAAIHDHGGIEVLLQAMQDHSGSEALCEIGLSALASMAAGSENATGTIRSYIQMLGGVELMFKIMHQHLESPDVMSQGCRMLANMAIGQMSEVIDTLCNAGSYELLTSTMQRFPRHAAIEKSAYRALVNLGYAQR